MDGKEFKITVDQERGILRFKPLGFWDLASVERYRIASAAAIAEMIGQGRSSGSLLVFIDRRDHPPQSQEVANAMQGVVASNGARARRSAVLVNGALNKIQTDRIRAGRGRVFTTEAETTAWLLAGDSGE